MCENSEGGGSKMDTGQELDLKDVNFDLVTGADNQEWCDQCKALKKEIQALKEEQKQSFSTLKKKIIHTDSLIKKFKAKCEEYEAEVKKNEESKKKLENAKRESTTLSVQLKSTLQNMEPLKQKNGSLEKEIKQKTEKLQKAEDELRAVEQLNKQYQTASSASILSKERLEEETKMQVKKIRDLETSASKQESQITKLKDENRTVKLELKVTQQRCRKMEKRLRLFGSKMELYRSLLKTNGLLPKGEKKFKMDLYLSDVTDQSQEEEEDEERNEREDENEESFEEVPCPHEHEEKFFSSISDEEDFSFVFQTFAVLSPLPPSPAPQIHYNDEDTNDCDDTSNPGKIIPNKKDLKNNRLTPQLRKQVLNESLKTRLTKGDKLEQELGEQAVLAEPCMQNGFSLSDSEEDKEEEKEKEKESQVMNHRQHVADAQTDVGKPNSWSIPKSDPTQNTLPTTNLSRSSISDDEEEVVSPCKKLRRQLSIDSENESENPKGSGDNFCLSEVMDSKSESGEVTGFKRLTRSMTSPKKKESPGHVANHMTSPPSGRGARKGTGKSPGQNKKGKLVDCLSDKAIDHCDNDRKEKNKLSRDHCPRTVNGSGDVKGDREMEDLNFKTINANKGADVTCHSKCLFEDSLCEFGNERVDETGNSDKRLCSVSEDLIGDMDKMSPRSKKVIPNKSAEDTNLIELQSEQTLEKGFCDHDKKRSSKHMPKSDTNISDKGKVAEGLDRDETALDKDQLSKSTTSPAAETSQGVSEKDPMTNGTPRLTRGLAQHGSLGFSLKSLSSMSSVESASSVTSVFNISMEGEESQGSETAPSEDRCTKEEEDIGASLEDRVDLPVIEDSGVLGPESAKDMCTKEFMADAHSDHMRNGSKSKTTTTTKTVEVGKDSTHDLDTASSSVNETPKVIDTVSAVKKTCQNDLSSKNQKHFPLSSKGKTSASEKNNLSLETVSSGSRISHFAKRQGVGADAITMATSVVKKEFSESQTSAFTTVEKSSASVSERTEKKPGPTEKWMKEVSVRSHKSRSSSVTRQTSGGFVKFDASLPLYLPEEGCSKDSVFLPSADDSGDSLNSEDVKLVQNNSSAASSSRLTPVNSSNRSARLLSGSGGRVTPVNQSRRPFTPPFRSVISPAPHSPLYPSPFDFIIPLALSPLPPSPVRDQEPLLSPLPRTPSCESELLPSCISSQIKNQMLEDESCPNTPVITPVPSFLSTPGSPKVPLTPTESSGKSSQSSAFGTPCAFSSKAPLSAIHVKPFPSSASAAVLNLSEAFHNVPPVSEDTKPCRRISFQKNKGSKAAKRKSSENLPSKEDTQEKKKCVETVNQQISPETETFTLKVVEAAMKMYLQSRDCKHCYGNLMKGNSSQEVILKVWADWVTQRLKGSEVEAGSLLEPCLQLDAQAARESCPRLSSAEHDMIKLFVYIKRHCQWDQFEECVLESLWQGLFYSSWISTTGACSLCRMFTAICRLNGNTEKARILYFHVLMNRKLTYPVIGLSMAGVWPLVFSDPTHTSSVVADTEGDAVITVIKHILVSTLTKDKMKPKHEKMLACLTLLCGWSRMTVESKTLLQQFLTTIKSEGTKDKPDTHEVFLCEKALTLLLNFESGEFFRVVFNQCGINQVTQRRAGAPFNIIFSTVVLRMYGCVLPRKTDIPQKYINTLIKYFGKLLTSEEVPPAVVMVTIEVLLDISYLSPANAINCLAVATEKMAPVLSLALKDRMKWTRQTLIEKFPRLRCSEFKL